MNKVFYLHETPLIKEAYRIVDHELQFEFSNTQTSIWLQQSKEYIINFMHKWCNHDVGPLTALEEIIKYEDIPSYTLHLVDVLLQNSSEETRQYYVQKAKNAFNNFRVRQDPFILQSERITSHLNFNKDLFHNAAKEISSKFECLNL